MTDTLTETRVGGGTVLLMQGSFTTTGQSSIYVPRVVLPQTAGVINPVWICLRGTFGSVQLEYSPDETNWHTITGAGTQLYIWIGGTPAEPFEPNIPGCSLRLNCTASAGTIYYDVRQVY